MKKFPRKLTTVFIPFADANFQIPVASSSRIIESWLKSKSLRHMQQSRGAISELTDAICRACDELLEGKLHDQFICDPIQGGAGTTANMNANEVIANRAIEILGGEKGDYGSVNPNDHVNRAQSTNDVIPTAAKLTTVKLLRKALFQLERLEKTLADKELEFHDVIQMGRTQMQDAVSIRLGAGSEPTEKPYSDIARLKHAKEEMYPINLGGTAIGTMLNANHDYVLALAPACGDFRHTGGYGGGSCRRYPES